MGTSSFLRPEIFWSGLCFITNDDSYGRRIKRKRELERERERERERDRQTDRQTDRQGHRERETERDRERERLNSILQKFLMLYSFSKFPKNNRLKCDYEILKTLMKTKTKWVMNLLTLDS